jgi:phosphomannomutase
MTHIFAPEIIREYDIRGAVGRTLFAPDAWAVGRGVGTIVRRAGGRRIVVGYDGRVHSPMLEAALVDGLVATGIDVVRIGLGPSPMLYFAEATLGVDGGIQVTGSHNPAEDNGFKIVAAHDGIFGDALRAMATSAATGDWDAAATPGRVTDVDVRTAYVDRLLHGYDGGTFRIGWDAGNGAAGPIVERLIRRLPGEHHLLYCDVDGTFPHHHPDPTVERNLADLKALVIAKKLDFGLAFDGDGDRIGAVDGTGRVIWGDEILSILAQPLLAELPGATIVADVKSSDALFQGIAAAGGVPLMWKSGHSHMKRKMKETGAALAGEMSGHIFFGQDYYGFDDALYAAVRLIRATHLSGRSLAGLRDAMPPRCATPEWRIPVAEDRKAAVVDEVLARVAAAGARIDRTDGARVSTADGWWLLRASNTQAALTLRAEAHDAAGLDRLIAAINEQLAASAVRR